MGQQTDDPQVERGLAAAAFADQRQRFPLMEIKRDLAGSLNPAPVRQVADRDILKAEDDGLLWDRHERVPYRPARSRGLKTSSSERVKSTRDSWNSATAITGESNMLAASLENRAP